MEVEPVIMESDTEMTIDYGVADDEEETIMKPVEEETTLVDEEMKVDLSSNVIMEDEVLPEADMKELDGTTSAGGGEALVMAQSELLPESLPTITETIPASMESLITETSLPSLPLPLPLLPIINNGSITLSAELTPFVPTLSSEPLLPPIPSSLPEKEVVAEEEKSIPDSIVEVVVAVEEAKKEVSPGDNQSEEIQEVSVEVETAAEEEVADVEPVIELEESRAEGKVPEVVVEEELSEEKVLVEEEEGLDERVAVVEVINEPNPVVPASDGLFGSVGCTCSSSTIARPLLDKFLLSSLDTSDALGSASEEDLTAPTVLLTYNNNTYNLFRRIEVGTGIEVDESLPVLFTEKYDHTLYYDTTEVLIEALRDALSDLREKEDEIVLSFNALGLTLSEDSIYTREVSLADFDRLHIGCGLPGRLHITLDLTARFSSGFNVLAQHVIKLIEQKKAAPGTIQEKDESITLSNSVDKEDEEGGRGDIGEESYEFVENNGEEGSYEEEEEDGEGTGSVYEDGEWISEVLEGEEMESAASGEEGEEGEVEIYHAVDGETEGEEEEFELGVEGEVEPESSEVVYDEETLANLDSDDLVAVIEGVEQDLVESELRLEEYKNENGGGGGGGGEKEEIVTEVASVVSESDEVVGIEQISSDLKEVEGKVTVEGEGSEAVLVFESTSNPEKVSLEIVSEETNGLVPSSSSSSETLVVLEDEKKAEITETEIPQVSEEEENNVVIDYDEVASSSLNSPLVVPVSEEVIPSLSISITTTDEKVEEVKTLDTRVLSPKRSHSSEKEDEVDEGDSKRPRLEPVSTA